MKKTVIYALALTVTSLVAGAVVGIAVDRQVVKNRLQRMHRDRIEKFQQSRQGEPKEIFERLSNALRLDEKQKEIAKQILEKARDDIAVVGKEAQKRILEVRNESHARMQEILNPEQQKQFQKIVSELEEKGQKARRFLQKRLSPHATAPHETPAGEEHLPPQPPGTPGDEDLPPPPEEF